MEGRFAEMEDRMKKMVLEMENLQRENEILRQRNTDSGESVEPSQNDRTEAESQSAGRVATDDEENKSIHNK